MAPVWCGSGVDAAGTNASWYSPVSCQVTKDGRFLLISVSDGCLPANKLWCGAACWHHAVPHGDGCYIVVASAPLVTHSLLIHA